MSEEIDVLNRLNGIEAIPDFSVPFTGDSTLDKNIVEHKAFFSVSSSRTGVVHFSVFVNL